MIADYVSADFGWLRLADGTRSARCIMRPGKNKDGYFTANDIQEQAQVAMDILMESYPDYEHVFVYDNASTHLKRADGSLSARKMPKFTPPEGKNWLLEVTQHDAAGKPVYKPDGKLAKTRSGWRMPSFRESPNHYTSRKVIPVLMFSKVWL